MYIVDTNVLLSLEDFAEFFEKFNRIYIPDEVLCELDKFKGEDGAKGFKARRAIKNIENFKDKIDFIVKDREFYCNFNIKTTYVDDIIISYFAEDAYKNCILITNDAGMRVKANAVGVKTISYIQEFNKIDINKVVEATDEEMEKFSNSASHENIYNLKIGQYLIMQNEERGIVFKYIGDNLWENVEFQGIGNYLFKVDPYDEFQLCAIDSLYKDDMSIIVGPAGTGKTLMSMAYCLQRVRQGARIHIFVNPVKTRGSEELGYYTGDRNEKLLQNSIGDILKNKIGDITEVENLIQEGSINLYPFSDIRGIEVRKGDIMYITEAQNLSIDMIKLAIQRCAEGSKIIIEGDPYTQVDKEIFSNNGNGLLRLMKVFIGNENISCVDLPNIYRSRFAELAEQL